MLTNKNKKMTNPFDTNSSSSSSQDQQSKSDATDFSVRTMQSDLAASLSKKTETATIRTDKIVPIGANVEQKKFNPDEINSQEINPLKVTAPAPEKIAPEQIREVITESPINKSPSANKIVLGVIIALIIIILGVGGYYFWMVNQQPSISLTEPSEETKPLDEPTVTIIDQPIEEQYSIDKPNFLAIDLTQLSAEEIKQQIIDTANKIKSTNNAYEFIVVDINNNPISFPIFATAAKLEIKPALLSSLAEKFSLYIYRENDQARIGLLIDINNKDVLVKEILPQEETFVTDAAFLFLETAPEDKNTKFDNSTYGAHNIRFVNLNEQRTLSIDYTITETQLIIATSKNTMRSILDKLTQDKNSSQLSIPTQNEQITASQTPSLSTPVSAPASTVVPNPQPMPTPSPITPPTAPAPISAPTQNPIPPTPSTNTTPPSIAPLK